MTSALTTVKLLSLSMVFMAFAASANAGTCEVRSVKMMPHFSDSLRPNVEEILMRKGYKIIRDGYLNESYDVPVDQLKVREDLLKPNTLLAIFNGEVSQDESIMCTKWLSGVVSCSFEFLFYQVTESGDLAEISRIKKEIAKKPSFFNSEDRIARAFMSEVLDAAEAQVPSCDKL